VSHPRISLGTNGTAAGQRAAFWCPGCDTAHSITVNAADGWGWNGDLERPTFTPSVLVHSHATLIDSTLEGAALTAPGNCTVTPQCHSFVTEGRIQFLGDSTHPLAGQTVDLPEWGGDQ
jgi:hypothetical protein